MQGNHAAFDTNIRKYDSFRALTFRERGKQREPWPIGGGVKALVCRQTELNGMLTPQRRISSARHLYGKVASEGGEPKPRRPTGRRRRHTQGVQAAPEGTCSRPTLDRYSLMTWMK